MRRERMKSNEDRRCSLRPALCSHAVLLALILLTFGSCVTEPREEFGPIPLMTQGVYVLNEGNFGRGNSSLTLYIPDSNRVYQDIFRAVNGRDLGDLGNDMVIAGTRAFIVMNGSDKIEVIRTSDHSLIKTIHLPPGRSPYNIVISGGKAYVSNLYARSVTAIDLTSLTTVQDSIPVGANPQGLAAISGKVYVCNSGFGSGRTVSVIDTLTDRVIRTISVGDGPSVAKTTPDGRIWVLCTGSYGDYNNPNDDTPGKIFIIHPSIDAVIDSISTGTIGHPLKMAISFDGYAYVVKDNAIMKYSTRIDQIISFGFIIGSATSTLYSVAVDDYTGDLYVGDARNFVQNGEVHIYRSDGVLRQSFAAGIIPGTIVFKR